MTRLRKNSRKIAWKYEIAWKSGAQTELMEFRGI